MAESTQVRLARLEEKFDYMADDIHQIKKILEGNGKPGALGRIDELEKKLSEYNGGAKMVKAMLGCSSFTGIVILIGQKLIG